MQVDYGTINRRKGQGLIPPNPRQWNYEHAGLDLREELGLDVEQSLDPRAAFALLSNAEVRPHSEIPAAAVYIEHFRKAGSSNWSGMAITDEEGYSFVFYNDSHPPNRVRTTLMEEFFHLRFGHPRSAIRIYGDGTKARTFQSEIEEEAYHSGAAALVPYRPLVRLISAGIPTWKIAKQFEVSVDLVVFRAKVTKCYRRARRSQ